MTGYPKTRTSPIKASRLATLLVVVLALGAQGWLLGAGWGPDGARLVRDHAAVQEGLSAAGDLWAPEAWPEAWPEVEGVRPWRPLALTAFAVEAAVAPRGMRVVTLLLHVLACVLLLAVFVRFLGPGRRGLALAAAALFAVHPIAAPALGPMGGQAGVLALCLALAAAWLFHEGASRQPAWLPLAALAFFLALLTHESVIGLPLLLWALGGMAVDDGASRTGRLLGMVLLVFTAGVFLALAPASPLTSVPLALEGLARSTAAVLLPLDLVRDALELAPRGGWTPGATLGLGLVVVALGLVAARALGRRWGPVAAGFVGFVGLASLGALLMPAGEVLLAGFAYPVAAGFFLVLGRGVVAVLAPTGASRPVAVLGATACAALILALGTLSWQEGTLWQTAASWHASLVARHPLRRDLALREVRVLRQEAATTKAALQPLVPSSPAYAEGLDRFRTHLGRARTRVAILIRRDPSDPIARRELGRIQLMAGQAPEAERTAQRALDLEASADAALLLARARDAQGQFESGREAYRLAVSLAPYDGDVLFAAARALSRKAVLYTEALALLDRAVVVVRDPEVRASLRAFQAEVRMKQREAADRALRQGHRLEAARAYREAAGYYEQALGLDPQRIEAWLQLAWIRGEYLGEYPVAEEILDRAMAVVDAAGGRGAGPAREKIRVQRDALEKARREDEAAEAALMGEGK